MDDENDHIQKPPIKKGIKYQVLVRSNWKLCNAVVLKKKANATTAAALDGS